MNVSATHIAGHVATDGPPYRGQTNVRRVQGAFMTAVLGSDVALRAHCIERNI